MNIGEANAVNTVLRWVLGSTDDDGTQVSDEAARKWAAWLADRANKAIGAGLHGDTVIVQWHVSRRL
ncbi:MAG: hypothetical protein ACRDQ1_11815 [Sciscionella sp.]